MCPRLSPLQIDDKGWRSRITLFSQNSCGADPLFPEDIAMASRAPAWRPTEQPPVADSRGQRRHFDASLTGAETKKRPRRKTSCLFNWRRHRKAPLSRVRMCAATNNYCYDCYNCYKFPYLQSRFTDDLLNSEISLFCPLWRGRVFTKGHLRECFRVARNLSLRYFIVRFHSWCLNHDYFFFLLHFFSLLCM